MSAADSASEKRSTQSDRGASGPPKDRREDDGKWEDKVVTSFDDMHLKMIYCGESMLMASKNLRPFNSVE